MRYQFFSNFFHLVKSLGPYEWENTQEQTFFGLLTKHYMWWTTLLLLLCVEVDNAQRWCCVAVAVGVISTLDAERSLGILKQNFVLLSCRHENAFWRLYFRYLISALPNGQLGKGDSISICLLVIIIGLKVV